VHNFVERDAEVGEIALSALNADGVGLVFWLVWNFFSVQAKWIWHIGRLTSVLVK
jgi:hypothetical protein